MERAIPVRLYAAALEAGGAELERFAAHLDAEERARAARFVFDLHRRRFVAAHGFLRETLARELAAEPAALAFELGPHGKPRVRGARLHFSLTHTGEHALLAVGERELGLDAEEIRPARVEPALARRVMTDAEFAAWSSAAREAQVDAFFRLWSAKESVMKAAGLGLSLAPQSFAVFAPEGLTVAAAAQVEGRTWRPVTLAGPAGTALALATDRPAEVERR